MIATLEEKVVESDSKLTKITGAVMVLSYSWISMALNSQTEKLYKSTE